MTVRNDSCARRSSNSGEFMLQEEKDEGWNVDTSIDGGNFNISFNANNTQNNGKAISTMDDR